MGYKKVIKLCNERKEKLKNLLDNDSLELKDEQVNHIRGAIDEIELICLTLQQYREDEIHKNYQEKAEAQKMKSGIFSGFGKIFSQKRQVANSRQFSLSNSYKEQSISSN